MAFLNPQPGNCVVTGGYGSDDDDDEEDKYDDGIHLLRKQPKKLE